MDRRVTTNNIINLLDVLIGPTEAVGDQVADDIILKNLKSLIDVTNWCLDGVAQSADTRHAFEFSKREIGNTAFDAMLEWRNWLSERVAVPDKIGEWIYDRPHHWKCSNCGAMWGNTVQYGVMQYCPLCGSFNGTPELPKEAHETPDE